MFYKESVDGQILQEGINEPGAMADWIAAATSYANNNFAMIPFYIYYSMFGFNALAYWHGQQAICMHAVSCWVVLPAVQH